MDPLLTVKEVAAILRVHPKTIYEKARKAEFLLLGQALLESALRNEKSKRGSKGGP